MFSNVQTTEAEQSNSLTYMRFKTNKTNHIQMSANVLNICN